MIGSGAADAARAPGLLMDNYRVVYVVTRYGVEDQKIPYNM